jgi:hypothetical protein
VTTPDQELAAEVRQKARERERVLDDLTRLGAMAADVAVMGSPLSCTQAERTRTAVRVALHQLQQQGYLTFTARERWPEFFEPDGITPRDEP